MRKRIMKVGILMPVVFLLLGGLASAAFVDNDDGTVTDTVTGLVWQQLDDGVARTWQQALSYAEGLTLASKSDWRLPNVRELESLVDYNGIGPAIDPVFGCVGRWFYWTSSTSVVGWQSFAWSVDFSGGMVFPFPKDDLTNYVRCVRGGPGGSFAHLTFSTVSSPQAVGGAGFNVTITAKKADGSTDTGFNGEVSLSASIGRLSKDKVRLANGTATLSGLSLDSPGTAVKLHASGGGLSGTSNAFDVTGAGGNTASISGKVVDSTQSGLSNATVYLSLNGTTVDSRPSGSNGAYAFTNLAPGAYKVLAISVDGRTSRDQSVRLQNNVHCVMDLTVAGSDCNPEGLTPVLLVPGAMGSTTGWGVYPILPRKAPAWDEWDGFLSLSDGLHDPFRKAGWRDLMDALAERGYLPECTMFPVPYDWRMDIDEASREYLKPWIDKAKERSGSDKVNVIAHSMGGLLTRSYIQGGNYDYDIDRFAMVGTPNHGGGMAYYLWEGGDPEMADLVAFLNSSPGWDTVAGLLSFYSNTMNINYDAYCGIPRPPISPLRQLETHRFIHRHVKSVEQLLPTYDFLIPHGELECNPNEWLDDLNSSSTKTRLGTATNSDGTVKTKVFAGKNQNTLSNIFVGPRQCSIPLLYQDGGPASSYLTQISTSGDGTVLTSSASLGTLVSYTQEKESSHTSLIKAYQCELLEFLELPECPVSASMPRLGDGLNRALTLTITGRAQPYITDPLGRKSGLNPATQETEDGIPGCKLTLGVEGASLAIEDPVDGTYTLTLKDGYTEDYQLQLSYADDVKTAHKPYWGVSRADTVTFTFGLDSLSDDPITMTRSPAPAASLEANPLEVEGVEVTKLCWQASSDPDVTAYNVYSKQEDETTLALRTTTASSCFQTDHPWAGDESTMARVYAVAAVKADGSESFLSDAAKNDDRDHDGLRDFEEAGVNADPTNPDTDGEGLLDGEEVIRGTDPTLPDTDGDGFTDFEEVQAGSDPLDPNSVPTPLVPDFSADHRTGAAPLPVQFSNTSTGVVAQCAWEFGDGTTSAEQNPQHTYSSPGTYTVKLTVRGQGGIENTTKASYITAIPGGDLAVTMTDGPDPLTVGNSLTYTVHVTNNGPSAASGIVLSDALPAGVAFVSAASGQGDCSEAGGTVTCNLGSLASGTGTTVTIGVTPSLVGALTNTVTVTSDVPDPNLVNNTASVTTTVTSLPVVNLETLKAVAQESGAAKGKFRVTRMGSTALPLKVKYTVSGTAKNGIDYTLLPGYVIIPASAASAVIVIAPLQDTKYEGDETVTVTLASTLRYVVGENLSGTVTVVDDDPPPPTVTVAAKVAQIQESAATPGRFVVSRIGDTSKPLVVYYQMSGTATNGTDYSLLPGQVTIPIGALKAPVVVTPKEDTLAEGEETVILTLAPSNAYRLGDPSSGTISILDND